MDEKEIISIEGSPAAIETSERHATVENGSPYACEAPRQPIFKTVGMYAFPCIIGLIYLAVAIFVIVMLYRLVRATEKIASRLEGGITVKKEESDNTI